MFRPASSYLFAVSPLNIVASLQSVGNNEMLSVCSHTGRGKVTAHITYLARSLQRPTPRREWGEGW